MWDLMISFIKSKRKNTKFERLLWLGVGLLAWMPLLAVLFDHGGELFTSLGFAAFFAGTAIIGRFLNWGPTVPCAILGIAIFVLFTDPIASSHEEAVFKDLGVPLIGAVFGAIIGLCVEWDLSHPQNLATPKDETPN